MPRYVQPPDLPAAVSDFESLTTPLSWGILRALHGGATLTRQELREQLGTSNLRTLGMRLRRLEAAGLVVVLPGDVPGDDRQGHHLSYRRDDERLDALVAEWVRYLRTPM